MKIDPSLLKSVTSSPVVEEQSRSTKQRAPAAPAAPESTSVHLSPEAGRMKALEKGFADSPAIDPARVAEIKLAISEGRFKIDASKIADGLIKTAQDLIQAHKGTQ